MKKIAKITLWIWTAILFISGLLTWFKTTGTVYSTEFNLQIAILNKIGMLMVWVAIFSLWFTLENEKGKQ